MDNFGAVKGERVIDVREIEPRVRHTVIFQLFEHLDKTSCLQLIAVKPYCRARDPDR